MLKNLLKLYRKSSLKTPLEDFITEVLVGILNLHEEVKQDYLYNFLKLPTDKYFLNTQVNYHLENDSDCIIDIVIESNKTVCFIENKVESKEGYRQLERYCNVLDKIERDKGKQTFLFYCTKYHDSKTVLKHSFKQIKWYEISKFLKKYKEIPIVNDFLGLLKSRNMAQELTLRTSDFIVFENIQETIKRIYGHLNLVKPTFDEIFKNKIKDYSGKQIRYHNRMIYYTDGILNSKKGWSNIMYGFRFDKPSIFVQIQASKECNQYQEFVNVANKYEDSFFIGTYSYGTNIELSKDLSIFLNDEKSDNEIKEWFLTTFSKFQIFIAENPNLNWSK
ncbi:MAG: PD-(D/E)XK nuclease family protein [Saprospiraceae bacterium]